MSLLAFYRCEETIACGLLSMGGTMASGKMIFLARSAASDVKTVMRMPNLNTHFFGTILHNDYTTIALTIRFFVV